MIFDPAQEVYYKLTVPAWKILSRWSSDIPLDTFCRRLNRAGMEVEGSDILMLYQFLVQNNLLVPDSAAFAGKAAMLKAEKGKHLFLKAASAYLFFRLPPWHPQKFIDRIKPYISFIGNRSFVLTLTVIALLGYLLVLRDLSSVKNMFADSFSWAGLVKYFFAVVVLKIIHEAGHLAGNIHFNCRVRAVGVSVIFLYPRFFSDTTDSWRLPRKQRLLIDAGGLLSELICGGIAALLWCYLPPGTLKSTMFFIFAVSTISTIFVNGNPLIRFDGYYILCDILGEENLMQRSGDHLKQFFRHTVFNLGPRPEAERGVLLLVFGISAFIYRVLLYSSIIFIIYNTMIKALAIVLLIMEVIVIAVLPVYNEVKIVRAMSKRAGRKARWWFAGVVAAAVLFVLFFPLSWRSDMPGELRSGGEVNVPVLETGYLECGMPEQAVPVRQGDVILKLTSPRLEMAIERCKCVIRELEILLDQQRSSGKTMGDSLMTRRRLEGEQHILSELEKRKTLLTIRAGNDGMFVPAANRISSGAILPRGTNVGVINTPGNRIYAYADDKSISKLKPGLTAKVYFPDLKKSFSGTISRISPVPMMFERSALLKQFGGVIGAVRKRHPDGSVLYQPENTLYPVEIRCDDSTLPQSGRTLRVSVSRREMLFDQCLQYLLYLFRQEF